MEKELLREIGIVLLMILVLFSAAAALFFAEGGEIYGFNHDPNAPSKPFVYETLELEILVDEEIVPIYDGTEIKSVELWQLPPKDILLTVITAPMAYIPPITAHLISLFISALGLAFLVLYRRKDSRENRQENGRPEQILAYLRKHPGSSLQQIADALGMPRSTLRHYLRRMQKKQTTSYQYQERPYYFAAGTSRSETEQKICIILSRDHEAQALTAIRQHPGITRRELAGLLQLSPAACDWYLQRFLEEDLLITISDGIHTRCRLTREAENACRSIADETSADPVLTVPDTAAESTAAEQTPALP